MTNLSFDYHNLHTQLPPEENAKRLKIVAEIIRTAQLRSVGLTLTNDLITNE